MFGIYENQAWPWTIELQLDSLTEAYSYGSSPEAGMPSLPFKDDSIRKSTEQPFFDVPYYEDDEQQDEVAPREESTADNLPKEGKLIGLH